MVVYTWEGRASEAVDAPYGIVAVTRSSVSSILEHLLEPLVAGDVAGRARRGKLDPHFVAAQERNREWGIVLREGPRQSGLHDASGAAPIRDEALSLQHGEEFVQLRPKHSLVVASCKAADGDHFGRH